MAASMRLAHVVPGDLSVDLGGRDVRVTEQRLDAPEIRTTAQQVGGEGMAKLVGMHPLAEPCGKRMTPHDLPKGLAGQGTAAR